MLYIVILEITHKMSTTTEYKTSEAHRRAQAKYIKGNREKSHELCAGYYQRNKERLKAKAKERYRLKKLEQARAALVAHLDETVESS